MSQRTWIHRIARSTVRPLIATPITPNHLTTLRLVTGLAAAVAFAVGKPVWTLWGGVLFVLSAFLDRADGELARISGKTSTWGHTYDVACDVLVNVVLFIGIGIGLSGGVLGAWAIALGLISGLAIGAIFWLVIRMEGNGGAEEPFPGAGGFDPDDVLFLIGPVAWFGALLPLLVAASIGAPLFLLFALWRYRQVRAA